MKFFSNLNQWSFIHILFSIVTTVTVLDVFSISVQKYSIEVSWLSTTLYIFTYITKFLLIKNYSKPGTLMYLSFPIHCCVFFMLPKHHPRIKFSFSYGWYSVVKLSKLENKIVIKFRNIGNLRNTPTSLRFGLRFSFFNRGHR